MHPSTNPAKNRL
ncbi:hypothetical protein ACS0PU_000706 [Formica fusca]